MASLKRMLIDLTLMTFLSVLRYTTLSKLLFPVSQALSETFSEVGADDFTFDASASGFLHN